MKIPVTENLGNNNNNIAMTMMLVKGPPFLKISTDEPKTHFALMFVRCFHCFMKVVIFSFTRNEHEMSFITFISPLN